MEKDQLYYKELLSRYISNCCSPNESEEILRFLQKDESNRLLLQKMKEEFDSLSSMQQEQNDRVRQQLLKKIRPVAVIPMKKGWWPRIAIAAAVILLIVSGGYFALFYKTAKQVANNGKLEQIKNDVIPGGDKATLTLADGTRINLDTADNGTLTRQGNIKVLKLNSGQLTYNQLNEGSTNASEVLYNIVSTPRGGQYRIELSDGTKVWLNAASSLRFPTAFTGGERKVEITGEAYFEVAHVSSAKGAMPFKVMLEHGTEIQVLGTHFNINSYSEEATMNVTLLEGSVIVKKGSLIKKLSPGQQVQVNEVNTEVVNDVNLEQVVAWKNGLFNFNGENMQSAMRQISRWYDVEVVYEKGIQDIRFAGKIQRSLTLSQIIEGLEDADIHFRIDRRKLIVFP